MNKKTPIKDSFAVSAFKSLMSVAMHTIYRLDIKNLNVPETGRLILTANHVSFVDAVLLASKIKRPVRFIVYYKIYDNPLLKPFFKATRSIPIAGAREDAQILRKALDDIAEALENDEAIFIFPEGKITYDGELNEFKPGIEMINKRTPSPVYPIVLKGLWGSHFSRNKNKPFFGKLFSKISIVGGDLIESKDVDRKRLYEITKSMLES